MIRTNQVRRLGVDELRPRVDFAALWRLQRPVWYRYVVPSHQFLLVERGRLRARTSAGVVESGPGGLFCLRTAAPNEYGFDAPVVYYESHITLAPPPLHRATLWLEQGPVPEYQNLGGRLAAVRSVFERMCLDIAAATPLARLRVIAAAYDLLALAGAGGEPAPAAHQGLDRWQQARLRLEEDLQRPLAIAAVARETGLGADAFIRGFRRQFGITPMAHRLQVRLRHAAALLAAGAVSVKQAAYSAGFVDASAFARSFQRHFQVAPSEYRRAGVASLPAPSGTAAGAIPINRHLRPPEDGDGFFPFPRA